MVPSGNQHADICVVSHRKRGYPFPRLIIAGGSLGNDKGEPSFKKFPLDYDMVIDSIRIFTTKGVKVAVSPPQMENLEAVQTYKLSASF